ncbi:MAG: protease complex subunit PrcB family protein [Planctomycetota bacterium]
MHDAHRSPRPPASRTHTAAALVVALMCIGTLIGCSKPQGLYIRSELQILAVNSGQVGPQVTQPIARVYKSPDDLPASAGQWLITAESADFAFVDWSRRDVVAVTLGQKPTSGFGIRIDRVVATDWGLEVDVTEIAPRPGQQVAQVVTHPWAAALVFKSDNTVISQLNISRAR